MRMLSSPRDEVAVLRDRRIDDLIQHVVRGIADAPPIQDERVAIRLLRPTDVTNAFTRFVPGLIGGMLFSFSMYR